MQIKSSQIIYSEHDYDECFEYLDGSGRVPDADNPVLILFEDVTYSKHDHKYWNNYELEQDVDRIVIG